MYCQIKKRKAKLKISLIIVRKAHIELFNVCRAVCLEDDCLSRPEYQMTTKFSIFKSPTSTSTTTTTTTTTTQSILLFEFGNLQQKLFNGL